MAEGFEPSIPHYSTDIYKPQQSLLIEEHMFLLFCADTPPHARHYLPLKALLFTSHTGGEDGALCYTLSQPLCCLTFFPLLPTEPLSEI